MKGPMTSGGGGIGTISRGISSPNMGSAIRGGGGPERGSSFGASTFRISSPARAIEQSGGIGKLIPNTIPLVAGQPPADMFRPTSALKNTVKIASGISRENPFSMPHVNPVDTSSAPSQGRITSSDIKQMAVVAKSKDIAQIAKVRESLAPLASEAQNTKPITSKNLSRLIPNTVQHPDSITLSENTRVSNSDLKTMKVIAKGDTQPNALKVNIAKDQSRAVTSERIEQLPDLPIQKPIQEIRTNISVVKSVPNTSEAQTIVHSPFIERAVIDTQKTIPVTPKTISEFAEKTAPYRVITRPAQDRRIGIVDLKSMRTVTKGDIKPIAPRINPVLEHPRATPSANSPIYLERLTELTQKRVMQEVAIFIPEIKSAPKVQEAQESLNYPTSITPDVFKKTGNEEEKMKNAEIQKVLFETVTTKVKESTKRVLDFAVKKRTIKIGTIVLPETQTITNIQTLPTVGTVVFEKNATDLATRLMPRLKSEAKADQRLPLKLHSKQQIYKFAEKAVLAKEKVKYKAKKIKDRIFEQDKKAMQSRSDQAHEIFNILYLKQRETGIYIKGNEIASRMRQTNNEKSEILKPIKTKVVDNSFIGFVSYVSSIKKLYDRFYASWVIRIANNNNPAVRESEVPTASPVSDKQASLVLASKLGDPEKITA